MKCTNCGSTSFVSSYAFSNGSYKVCKNCGSASYLPIPSSEEINAFYLNYVTYKSGLTEYMTEDSYPSFVSNFEYTLDDLKYPFSQSENKEMIDIGCGNGFLLQYIKEKHPLISVKGIDLSQECVAKCNSKGLIASAGDVFSIDKSERFDYISLIHVIEHVTNPKAWLQRIYELLKPGGSFILETPVYGPVAEAFGSNWRYFMPIEHLCLFSTNALTQVLKQLGFEIINQVTYGSGNNGPDINGQNKSAMDRMVKKLGVGDTFAVHAKK